MSIFDDIKENIVNFFTDLTTNYGKSKKWVEYKLGVTKQHCLICVSRENKIYEKTDLKGMPTLPEHERCACYFSSMRVLQIGQATKLGKNGADYYLHYYNKLPDYYITKEEAISMGWISIKGNLDKVAPGKMIGGNVYYNRENKLPDAPGRIWYECDVDYQAGYRNNCRLLYSNDGLIFKTDYHYSSYIAIE